MYGIFCDKQIYDYLPLESHLLLLPLLKALFLLPLLEDMVLSRKTLHMEKEARHLIGLKTIKEVMVCLKFNNFHMHIFDNGSFQVNHPLVFSLFIPTAFTFPELPTRFCETRKSATGEAGQKRQLRYNYSVICAVRNWKKKPKRYTVNKRAYVKSMLMLYKRCRQCNQ